MPTKVDRETGDIVRVVHEPGNMTRYEVIACEFRRGQWLAAAPYWNCSFFVLEGAELHYGYIREKCPRVRSDIDASEIAKAIAAVVPGCTVFASTGDDGNPTRRCGKREEG